MRFDLDRFLDIQNTIMKKYINITYTW